MHDPEMKRGADRRDAEGNPNNETGLAGFLDTEITTNVNAEQARLAALREAYIVRRLKLPPFMARIVSALVFGSARS